MSSIKYYQESLKVNSVGILFHLLSSLFFTMLLGYVYTLITVFVPIIYFNFLVTFGVGLVLGVANRVLARLTNNRNKRSRIVLSLTSGLMVCYFQWTTYIVYLYQGQFPTPMEFFLGNVWIFNPSDFVNAILEINRVGAWSIFGIQFKGFVLTGIWIIEASILIILPITAIRKTEIYPYSEFLEKWYPKYTLSNDLESISTINKFTNDLSMDAVTAINSLKLGDAFRHTKIHLFYLKDEEHQYLTVEQIFIDGRGSGKKNRTIIINNLEVPNKIGEKILQTFEHKFERVDIF